MCELKTTDLVSLGCCWLAPGNRDGGLLGLSQRLLQYQHPTMSVRSELLTVMYSEYQVSLLFYATLSHVTKSFRTMSKSQDSRFTCLCNTEMCGVTGEISRTNKQGVARTGLAGGGDVKPLSGTFSLCIMTEPESFSMCYSSHTQRGGRPSSSVRRHPKGKQGATVSIWVFFL